MKVVIIALSILMITLSSHYSIAASQMCSQIYDDSQIGKIQKLYDLLRQDDLADLSKESIQDQLEVELFSYQTSTGKSTEEIMAKLDGIPFVDTKKELEAKKENIRTSEERLYDPLIVVDRFLIPVEAHFVSYRVAGTKVIIFYRNEPFATGTQSADRVVLYDLVNRKVESDMPIFLDSRLGKSFSDGRFYVIRRALGANIVYDLQTKEPILDDSVFLTSKKDSNDTFILFDRFGEYTEVVARAILNPHNRKRLDYDGQHAVTKDYALISRSQVNELGGETVTLYDKELSALNTFPLSEKFKDGFVLSQKNQVVLIDIKNFLYIFDMATGDRLDKQKISPGTYNLSHRISPNESHVIISRLEDDKSIYYYNSDLKTISATEKQVRTFVTDDGVFFLPDAVSSYQRFQSSKYGIAQSAKAGRAIRVAIMNLETGDEFKKMPSQYFQISDNGTYYLDSIKLDGQTTHIQVQVYGERQ